VGALLSQESQEFFGEVNLSDLNKESGSPFRFSIDMDYLKKGLLESQVVEAVP
jgi:hypothetical protein